MARLYASVKVGDQVKFVPLAATLDTDGLAVLKVDTELELDGNVYIDNLKIGSLDQTKANTRFLKVLDDGTLIAVPSPTELYRIADVDDAGAIKYYGFVDVNGGWYILKEDTSGAIDTYRYIKGDTDYPTNFGIRGTFTYDYFNNIF